MAAAWSVDDSMQHVEKNTSEVALALFLCPLRHPHPKFPKTFICLCTLGDVFYAGLRYFCIATHQLHIWSKVRICRKHGRLSPAKHWKGMRTQFVCRFFYCSCDNAVENCQSRAPREGGWPLTCSRSQKATSYNVMKWITISNSPILTLSSWLPSGFTKSKVSVACMFWPAGLVRLFYLSYFLCPPSWFICAGLADVGLGRGLHIFEQGPRRSRGSLNFKLAPPERSNAAPAAAARCLPQPVFFSRNLRNVVLISQMSLHPGKTRNTEGRKKIRTRRRRAVWHDVRAGSKAFCCEKHELEKKDGKKQQ